MTLDRGVLAKIDRRILSELDHAGGVQLAKIPLSDAVWSTWRRYCDVVGATMGQGIGGAPVAPDQAISACVRSEGRSKRAVPVRVRPQVQALSRPCRPPLPAGYGRSLQPAADVIRCWVWVVEDAMTHAFEGVR
jgi:hypothetical protein